MNVQIKVNGLARVDFVSSFGWVRNPEVELCGVDDMDTCVPNVQKFLESIEPAPYENLGGYEQYVDGALKDIQEAAEMYAATQQEVSLTRTIHVYIRPVPKSSQDA